MAQLTDGRRVEVQTETWEERYNIDHGWASVVGLNCRL